MTIKNRYKSFLKMFDKAGEIPGPGKYEVRQAILNPKKGRTICRAGRGSRTSRAKNKVDRRLRK
jgi:hypothetical protein